MRNKRLAAIVAALVVAATGLLLVEKAPKTEVEFPVTLPSTRGFGPACSTSDFVQVTIYGEVVPWHSKAVLPLKAALALAKARSDYVPRSVQVYNCRHIGDDPSKPMSHHAWALAVDFDPSLNPYGVPVSNTLIGSRYMDFVRAFERAGFTWGGRWSTPDAMHFEWDGPPLPTRKPVHPGDHGKRVEVLEDRLRAVGLPVKADGVYEGKDILSVVAFQKKNGILDVEAIDVGPVTWLLLELAVR